MAAASRWISVLTGEARRRGAVAASGFHDQNVGADAVEFGGLEEGLIVEANVAGVEKGLRFPAHQKAGGAESVAGIEKLERGAKIAAGAVCRRQPNPSRDCICKP